MRDRHLYQQESALLSPPALHWARCGYRHWLGRRSSPRAVVGASTIPDRRSRPGLQDPIRDQSSPRPASLWLLVFNSQAGYLGANQEPREVLQFILHHIPGRWILATSRCLGRSTCPSFSHSSSHQESPIRCEKDQPCLARAAPSQRPRWLIIYLFLCTTLNTFLLAAHGLTEDRVRHQPCSGMLPG